MMYLSSYKYLARLRGPLIISWSPQTVKPTKSNLQCCKYVRVGGNNVVRPIEYNDSQEGKEGAISLLNQLLSSHLKIPEVRIAYLKLT
jgi:hypothetical protein